MKNINILKKTLVALTLTLAATGAFTTKAEAKVDKIKVTAPSGKTVRVAKGKKVKLKTTVKKLKNKNVKFKSNNPKVARVNAKGYVKGIKNGKTKIIVSSKSNPKIKKVVKVVVYKKAVKKIKLNKKKVDLKNGEQFKLVAKVSPKKNVSKVLSYKSSNKKVATVSKKGIIKAVSEGTAKITVKATDGSKKKTTCVVTVNGSNNTDGKDDGDNGKNDEKTVGIKSVKQRSAFSIDVELTGAKVLTYEDFEVLCKLPGDKDFKDVFDIISLNTSDNIHYEVVIRENKMFECNAEIKVIISSLDGVKEKTAHIDKWFGRKGTNYNGICDYAEGTKLLSRDFGSDVGKSFGKSEDFDEFARADLKKITVSELPKGLEAYISDENDYIYVSGIFAEKANGFKVVITATDMNDDEFTIEWIFYIGDEDTLYVKSHDVTYLSYAPNESDSMKGTINFSTKIVLSGTGFDSYNCTNYKAEGLPDNTYIVTNMGIIYIKDFSKPVKAGIYDVTVSGTTPRGQNFTTKFKLTIVDGIVVKGRLMDPSGKPLNNVEIVFKKKFYNGPIEAYENVTTDENGYYQRRFIPGIYDVNSKYDNIYNSYFVDLVCDTTLNMKSLCYKVTFANPVLDKAAAYGEIGRLINRDNCVFDVKGNKNEIISQWDDYENNTYKFSLFTYVKKGTYNFGEGLLNFDRFKEPEQYKVLTKQFVVSESGEVNIDLEKVENN